MKILNIDTFAALIGIDWADTKHDICLQAKGANKLVYSQIQHKPEAIETWALSLRKRFEGEKIAIALELKSGPLVHALLCYDFITLVPICPKGLSKYRESFTQSGAKDDPTDAYLALDFLSRHPDKLKPLNPDTEETRIIQRMVEHRRVLVQERVRTTNRITATIKEYYPQALEWFNDIDTILFCDFIEQWPSLQNAKKAHKNTLETFFYSRNSRHKSVIDKRINGIKTSIPLTDDNGVIEPNQFLVLALLKILRQLIEAVKQYDKFISEKFKLHSDFELFNSLPGAGPVFASRLLAAMGSNRERFQSSDELVRQVGVAPVVERSGKKTWIHWRYSCPKFVRQTFVEWAGYSLRESYWAQEFYGVQRAKGKGHQTALRSLAFKWARILYRCWKNHECYDEAKYLMVLKKKGSTLVAHNS